MVFVGPSPESVTEMGQKHRARDLAVSAGVPVVPGTDLLKSEEEAFGAAEGVGFPVCGLFFWFIDLGVFFCEGLLEDWIEDGA